jgi:hypothetical protein
VNGYRESLLLCSLAILIRLDAFLFLVSSQVYFGAHLALSVETTSDADTSMGERWRETYRDKNEETENGDGCIRERGQERRDGERGIQKKHEKKKSSWS